MKILKTSKYIDLVSKLAMYKELLRVERIFTEKQEKQIEKMKICENCKKVDNCKIFAHVDIKVCDKWELAE